MNYIYLLIVAFLTSFGMGYAKFFGLEYITETYYTVDDRDWIIQMIGSLMTLGPFLVFPLSAPMAAAFKKRYIMFGSTLLTSIFLLLGYFLNWPGSAWLYIFIIGILMGSFSVAKMASVPLEAERSNRSIFSINAGLTIVFIIGMLSGIFCGAKAYEWNVEYGLIIGICVFAAGSIPGLLCRFPLEKTEPMSKASHELLVDSLSIIVKYPLYLFSSPILWGVASALSLAVTAYSTIRGLGSPSECSLMPLYASIGIIVGNVLSTKFTNRRYIISPIMGLLMAASIPLIPLLVEMGIKSNIPLNTLYYLVSLMLIFCGALFGCCTNLIDSEFLGLTAKDGKEGTGAAIQSVFLSIFTFSIGGGIGLAIYYNIIGAISQFIVLSLISVIGVGVILLLSTVKGGMNEAILKLIYIATRFMVGLRYKITLNGIDKINNGAKGLLILPNHPAEVDPVILTMSLWKKIKLRPVADEEYYKMPIINKGFKLINTIPMPDMSTGAGYFKRIRIERTLKYIEESLQNGDNVMLYPSGHLTRTGLENIGGASAAARLINNVPEAKIVLVRTTGLWGSSFSTAQTAGVTPDLLKCFKNSIITIIKNLIFFTPRRELTIEIKPVARDYFTSKQTLDINKTLEKFYNTNPQEVKLVPYSCWNSKLPELKVANVKHEVADTTSVPDEIANKVKKSLAEILKIDSKDITPDMALSEDLAMDSIDTTEVMIWLEDEYDVSGLEVTDLKTVADIMVYAAGIKKTDSNEGKIPTPKEWTETASRPDVMLYKSKTIGEAFLQTCDRMGDAVAIADDTSGVMTWKKLKVASLLMADLIRRIEGDHVGIMLPASVGASLITIATILAGKIPVMLNWTTGRKNLEHAAEVTKLTAVLTSGKFLDKLVQADFGNIEEKFLFLEDMRSEATLDKKLIALLKARNNTDSLMKELELEKISGDGTAVVLFTSGSESAPKGVPLSHKNILTNIRGALETMNFNKDDVLYAFLPPFHSFGLTVTTLLPLTTGLKVAFYPNPTEGSRIAAGCEQWDVSLMAGTPSFINGILRSSTPSQVKRIRLLVAGAEKAPQDLFDIVNKLGTGAEILEGYGITECAPVLTCNRPGTKKEGVGLPFPGVEIIIVDPDTHQILPSGERGLILAYGDNVFSGYLNYPIDPFIVIDNKKWYNTGDLGILSDDNYLTIAGRMKRFVKIGGEMISLPAIEEALSKKWPSTEDGPVLAVHAIENEGEKTKLVLFSAAKISTDDANQVLKESGFSSLSKISKCIELEAIPILGTGKTDYQTLKTFL